MSTPYPPPPPTPPTTPAPPASSQAAVVAKAPPFGWGAVAAGVLGILALVLPWFSPSAKVGGESTSSDTSFHAWNGYLFLVVGPALLISFGLLWFQGMRGTHNNRFASSRSPVRSLSLQSIGAGAVAIVIGILAFPVFAATYKIKTSTSGSAISWGKFEKLVKAAGGSVSKGPQFGLWLLFIGGVILIVVGVLGFLATNAANKTAPAAGDAFGGPTPGYDQPGGYQQPGGYPHGGFDQQPGYQQPGYEQPGYEQPAYPQQGYQQPGGPQ